MTLSIELWQLVGMISSVVGVLTGAFAFLLRLLLRQFEQRLAMKFEVLEDESRNWNRVEHDLVQLRLELPERYVRREDYIRNQTIIESKLDLINERVARWHHQGGQS